jgi:membrane fusion protein (multidrug efflux system)
MRFRMSKGMYRMLAAVIAVVAILGFVKFQQIRAAMAAGKSWAPPPESVTTYTAAVDHWQGTFEAVGSVEPVQGVTLSADLSGVVHRIGFQSGAPVREGQMLVELDSRQERAQLASAQARLQLAKNNWERAKKLLETQAIAQAEADQQEALFRQAEASVNEIEATIQRKMIRAPFAGIAGIRQVNVGQYVNSGDPIVPVQSRDPIYVDFAVPQQTVRAIKVGAVVTARAGENTGPALTGKVTAINPVVQEDTRNVQVQATFRNPRGEVAPGMFVTVQVNLGGEAPIVALPVTAINYAPYGNSVFIVEQLKDPQGKAYKGVRQQFVKLGSARGDQVAILDGVKPGQEVATSGVFKLRSGAAVVVNNTVTPSNNPAPKPADS